MAFCSNCGQQIADGTVFCGNCGARQDGAGNYAGSPSGNQVDANEFAKIAKGTLVGMLTSPVTTIRSIVDTQLQYALLMAGALVVIYGLVVVLLTQIGASYMFGGLPGFGGAISDAMGQVFLGAMIGGLLMIVGMFLGLFLMGKAFGGGGEAGQYLVVATAIQVPVLAALTVGVILVNLTPYLLMLVVFIGSMLSVICNYCGMHQVSGLNENKSALASSLSYIVMLLFLFLIANIAS